MPGILNAFFKVLAFVSAMTLIFRLWLAVLRVEYAEAILARTPEQRKRTLASYRGLVQLFKLLLFSYPVIIAAFVALYWLSPGLDGVTLLLAGLVFGLLLATEYCYEKWLVRYITQHEEQTE